MNDVIFSSRALSQTQVLGRLVFEDDLDSEGRPLGLKGKKGRFTACTSPAEAHISPLPPECFFALVLVGAGRRADLTRDVLRDVTAAFVRHCLDLSLVHIALQLPDAEGNTSQLAEAESCSIAVGTLAGNYRFDRYLSPERRSVRACLESFTLLGGDEGGLEQGKTVGSSLAFAKDLCNEPGNVLNPVTFAEAAERLAHSFGLDCTIYDEKEMAGYGMNALLSVGRGSAVPPRLVHLVYRPEGPVRRRVTLVGKGVTFDSGGLCVKTRENIKTMKHDKSGACVVLGALRAAAALRLPVELHGIAGLVENMPDGGAYRPDDIIRAMNGKTIEIQNTDAEGRLVLADLLTFASRLAPDAIIDIATLTGSAIHALGKYTAALVSDDDALSKSLEAAARTTGERFHRFRMDDSLLREGLKGLHADLRQSSPDGGGTLIGGMFLREFVGEGIPWAHLDIAATGWYDKEFGVYSQGASAYGMKTLVAYISQIY
ncbi:MAG: leucyl aminopeptidase family protein [Fretibacterium sp.]|nr:leucyl aminopeptidase family protein [Fretibacterium sp.]